MRASPIYRHLMKFLETWRVLYNSRIIQNILHNFIYKPRYKNIQEIPRILQKALDSSYAFHHSVEMCGHFQVSLEPFILFPPMAQCRWLQESPKASYHLYNPYGEGHLKHLVTFIFLSSYFLFFIFYLFVFSFLFYFSSFFFGKNLFIL